MMQIQDLILIALFAAITAVCSIITIPIGMVPITLSLVAVFLCGVILEPKAAALAQIVYLLVGLIGLPVFSGMRGGLGVLLGPTGGYLLAYPLMAWLTAWLLSRLPEKKLGWAIASLMLALLICYGFGTAWLCGVLHLSLRQGLLVGVVPFIVFDLIKIGVAASVGLKVSEGLKKSHLI